MKVATISKHFTFHAAHQLLNHDGPCRDLHGHSYKLEVSVTDRVKQPCGDSDEGMVLDFTELKDIYKEHIEPYVEHKFLNETLPISVTTSEYIALWAHWVFKSHLIDPDDRSFPERSVFVRLWETPTSYAEVGDTPWRKYDQAVPTQALKDLSHP